MASDDSLQAPVLLVAMPQILDGFFHRSVVLLVHHDGEGSLGFIVNRPTAIQVAEILEGMEIGWEGAADAVAHFGGPVQPQLGTVVFTPRDGTAAALPESQAEICPGLRLTQHVGDLEQLAASPPRDFRLLLGYAGWGAGQLLEEILRNDWITAPVEGQLVFGADAEGVWSEALRSVGIDPATLPNWSAPGGEESAN
ncbi:MAG TPA: YqgE/AlgH family protein [Thermoanaerobaculia bacterium]|nr:YqgE/AlgH family protein [Thermoanaerobaculia bacterium]